MDRIAELTTEALADLNSNYEREAKGKIQNLLAGIMSTQRSKAEAIKQFVDEITSLKQALNSIKITQVTAADVLG